MKRTNLKIKNFTDIQSFLNAHVVEMKERNPRWSVGAWSLKLNSGSRTMLVKILNGQRVPGAKMMQALSIYFEFTKSEAEHFHALIQLKKVGENQSLKNAIFDQLQLSHSEIHTQDVDLTTQSILKHWYCLPILAIIHSKSASHDPKKIAKRLSIGLSEIQIMEVIKNFESAGLIEKKLKGRYQIVKSWQMFGPIQLKSQNKEIEKARNKFFLDLLENTTNRLASLNSSETDLRATCVTIQKKNLDQARELIRQFTEKFSDLVTDDKGEEIYQLQIQLIPMTHS